jgi:hypothetical protein
LLCQGQPLLHPTGRFVFFGSLCHLPHFLPIVLLTTVTRKTAAISFAETSLSGLRVARESRLAHGRKISQV